MFADFFSWALLVSFLYSQMVPVRIRHSFVLGRLVKLGREIPSIYLIWIGLNWLGLD